MYVRVKVFPHSKKERYEQIGDALEHELWHIYVKEKPLMNEANNRVCEILAEIYGVSRTQVRITSGHRKGTKLFFVTK